MEKIDVNGIRLAYVRKGTGTPLLLIHGYPLDHTIWDEVLPLLEKDFDLILPDVRGFGESTTITSQYSMNDIASDFVALLDHLGIQKAALAGHSMGGYIALAFARLHPERENHGEFWSFTRNSPRYRWPLSRRNRRGDWT